MFVMLGLSSCSDTTNPMDDAKPGEVSVKTYQYIVPAVGNIQLSPDGSYQNTSDATISNWGGWTSIPIGAQGAYTVSEDDIVTIGVVDMSDPSCSSANLMSNPTGCKVTYPGIQGTVFNQSTVGSVTVASDGNLYFPSTIYRENIQAPTKRKNNNCFSALDWGVFLPSSYKPCLTANSQTCQQTSGSQSCQQGSSSTTCTPTNYPVLTPVSSLPPTSPMSNATFSPLKVYGPKGRDPGDFYMFFMHGASGRQNKIYPSSSVNNDCGFDFTTCASSGAVTSGSGAQDSCIKADSPPNQSCVLANGQGLDILTCDDDNNPQGTNCKSIRGPQVMKPFISYSDYFGTQIVPAPVINGQTVNVPPVQYSAMLGNAINASNYLYPQDQILTDVTNPLTSPAATSVMQDFKSFSVMFGSDVGPPTLNGDDNGFTGGKKLAFKIDPTLINSASPNSVTGEYNIGYHGYSPKDATTGGATYQYSSGDLVFTFAGSAPANTNPDRGTCDSSGSNGICSFSLTGDQYFKPKKGLSLYMRVADTIAPDNDVDGCYLDNYGYYLVNITVINVTKVQYGWFEKISSYVISFIVNRLNAAITNFYGSIVNNTDFINIVRLMVTFYISLYGAYFVLGLAQATASDVLLRILKIAIMFVLISPNSYDFFNTYLFGMITEGFIQIAGFAIDNSGAQTPEQTLTSAFSFVDPAINIFFSPNIWKRMLVAIASVYTAFIVPMFIYAMFSYFKVIIEGFLGYLVMLTSIYLMVGMFPLFAIFILFDYTRKYFWGWLNYTINFCLQPIIFLIFLLFMNHLIMVYLNTFISFSIDFGCWLPIFINITDLVGTAALFLPAVKVEIACIPWFLVGKPVQVIVNGLTLLLMVKSVKSMLDFVPILAEQLMSSGFGADSGGVQVAPGAVPGMTGGGTSGFGREASLAKGAYEGARKGLTSLVYDEDHAKKLKQGRDDKFARGGPVTPSAGPAAANPGGSGSTPVSTSGTGGKPGVAGGGGTGSFTPSSLAATGAAGGASASSAILGKAPTVLPPSGTTPPQALKPGAAVTGLGAASGGRPISVKDAVAERIAAATPGVGGVGGRPEASRLATERADRAKSISGAHGSPAPSPTAAGSVRARSDSSTRPGTPMASMATTGRAPSQLPPTTATIGRDLGRPKSESTDGRGSVAPITSDSLKAGIANPIVAGRTLDQLRGPKAASDIGGRGSLPPHIETFIPPVPEGGAPSSQDAAARSAERARGPQEMSAPRVAEAPDRVPPRRATPPPRSEANNQTRAELIDYGTDNAPHIDHVRESYPKPIADAYATYQESRSVFDRRIKELDLDKFEGKSHKEVDQHFDRQFRAMADELQIEQQAKAQAEFFNNLKSTPETRSDLDAASQRVAFLAGNLGNMPDFKQLAHDTLAKKDRLGVALDQHFRAQGGEDA